MEMLSVRQVASVKLFTVEVSEAELDLYERCMRYIYENFTAQEIKKILGSYDDELLGICEDVTSLLEAHTDLKS